MMKSSELERLYQTLRWLRPRQLYGRAWFRAYRPRPDRRPAPGLRFAAPGWVPPAARQPSLQGPELVCLLDEARDISHEGAWDDPTASRLWRYHLHYFDDLNARGAASRGEWHEALIARWLAEVPAGRGAGWEPYPVSLRIVNWIKWALGGGRLSSAAVQSLAVQARWLDKKLEWHLLGNHLWSNAKALCFAGVWFAGAEADGWRARGVEILSHELGEQLLGDGGHFERTPMYHALACEDVLDLLNVARCFPGRFAASFVERLEQLAPALLHWLDCLCHPDGEIASFNDSALGLAPTREELSAYAARLGLPAPPPPGSVEHLAASGYVRASRGPFVLLHDVGSVGPDYLPGHAHAGSLSFELSAFGSRWVVDSGCSTYAVGPERLRQRGTLAHNTVCVDGCDSSEVWGSFRVGRRARVHDVALREDGVRVVIDAWHDGYLASHGVSHRRRMELDERALQIEDHLQGAFERAESRLHLHPEVTAQKLDASRVALVRGGQRALLTVEGAELAVADSTWHPSFNRSLPSHVLVATFAGPRARSRLEVA
jgi:uncharacterized heparinase superfamily protein